MKVLILYNGKWVYLSSKSGSYRTDNVAKAYPFTEKECEAVVEYMKSLGFKVNVEA